MEQWITEELERTELGDKRRTKRLMKIVSNLSEKESIEFQGTMTVEVKRNPTRPSRKATLAIRYATITIKPPQNRAKKEQLAPITLQAILVTEVDPPTEVEPISWLLLTTLEITHLEDVKKYVQWYCYRWLIELYHYVLKSGCGIEKEDFVGDDEAISYIGIRADENRDGYISTKPNIKPVFPFK